MELAYKNRNLKESQEKARCKNVRIETIKMLIEKVTKSS